MINFESQYEKVVGGESKEERKEAEKRIQDRLERLDTEAVGEFEVDKTEQEEKIIETSEDAVDEMVERWGGEPKKLPPHKIHILEPEAVGQLTAGKLASAFYAPGAQFVGIERRGSGVDFATSVAHEFFHAKSYKAAQVMEDGKDAPWRSGVQVYEFKDKRVAYFGALEEAIVGESTRLFFEEKVKNNPMFKDEVEAVEEIKKWLRSSASERKLSDEQKKAVDIFIEELYSIPDAIKVAEVLVGDKDDEYKRGFLEGAFSKINEERTDIMAERYEERHKLYELMDQIIENSSFETREELFEEFAKANFSGSLLPLAKIVENALGKGAFRRVAEDFKEEL
ncbi:MAG: hypothetical protein R3346_00575 [Candidatus Spechtbacterales bacterium]|nr:hypothetical protein [Candidatus Spechtbacterales bacterium]